MKLHVLLQRQVPPTTGAFPLASRRSLLEWKEDVPGNSDEDY